MECARIGEKRHTRFLVSPVAQTHLFPHRFFCHVMTSIPNTNAATASERRCRTYTVTDLTRIYHIRRNRTRLDTNE